MGTLKAIIAGMCIVGVAIGLILMVCGPGAVLGNQGNVLDALKAFGLGLLIVCVDGYILYLYEKDPD